MATYSAQDGYVGLAEQDSQGVFKNPTDFMKVQSIDLNPDDTKIMPDPEIGSGRDIDTVDQGAYQVTGTLDTYCRQEAVLWLVKAALGGYVASGEQNGGEGDYLHVFTPIASGSLPWMSLEQGISDQNYVLKATDVKVNELSLSVDPNQYATMSFDLVGISDEYSATRSTPTFDETPLFVGNGVDVSMNGADFSVKSLSFSLNNNLVDDDYRLGSRFLGDITERRRELTVSMEVTFDPTNDLYRKAFYGSASATSAGYDVYAESLEITFNSREQLSPSGGNYRWTVQMENCVFMASPVSTSGDELVTWALELTATKDATIDNLLRWSAWNGKASYA